MPHGTEQLTCDFQVGFKSAAGDVFITAIRGLSLPGLHNRLAVAKKCQRAIALIKACAHAYRQKAYSVNKISLNVGY